MTDPESSPASYHLPRSASASRISPQFKSFLPLVGESNALTTRGQNLPNLLSGRRPSTLRSFGERRGSASSDEDLEGFRHGLLMGFERDFERDFDAERRMSAGAAALNTPQMRSMRLIGNSNPRYKWEKHFKTEKELEGMKKHIRQYYERNNYLLQHYMYIDRVLDSSLPHNLIQEYSTLESGRVNIPSTISEEAPSLNSNSGHQTPNESTSNGTPTSGATPTSGSISQVKIKRTPKNLYKVPEADENTPLLRHDHGVAVDDDDDDDADSIRKDLPDWEPEEEMDTESPIVKLALYINLAANATLLVLKIIVTVMTSSLSVLASLVDAALDFLSTAIVWFTSWMIARQDRYKYPVGRRRLEPIGVLVFSVIMITSFFQVGIEAFSRLNGNDHSIVELTIPAIAIMASTVVIKGACWLWCRLIPNSSVQALAQDAETDVVFNIFSIIFPLVGFYAKIWWLDPLGGLLLSLYVIVNWSRTSLTHIRNLAGAAATADERNILLYLTMRFAKSIKQIQGLEAYHAGDKLNVEVDIVVDENIRLRDSHDLGESLQYVLESVPYVDRAFVHIDYASWNLPTHMSQQE